MIETLERWHQWYPEHVTPGLDIAHETLTEAWAKRVKRDPEGAALRYFEAEYSARTVDETADALAAGLQGLGVGQGDVVGIQLQNIPQFSLVELALWRIGAVALVLNPMYKLRELSTILADAEPVGVIGAEGAIEQTMRELGELAPGWVLTTREYEVQGRQGRRPGELGRPAEGALPETDLFGLIERNRGAKPAPAHVNAASPALLTYTSGTTGAPKGAVATHRNLLATGEATRQWLGVQQGERVLAVAPLFHITGAVATGVMALVSGAELVFIGRLKPEYFLEAIDDYGIHHICGSITAYNALLDLPHGGSSELRSLRTVFSGGAPVPPRTVERFAERFGHYIRNIYGMTETASACIAVPRDREAPIDEATQTLAIGVALPGVRVRVRDSAGHIAQAGELGELEIKGPSVTAEYLNKPEATAGAIVDGWLRTGDIACIDEAGWVYLIDRKKDQINVSGYKVWPREVEDVLYEHEAVREAAVIGRPNAYSGEEVIAFVSLQSGARAEEAEIQAHVKARLASYKTPREVHILPDLPKTATGKIQRLALRE
ncbi:MAG: class I adenylate-forming enzyme family protein [Microbacteriaceae bacterium]